MSKPCLRAKAAMLVGLCAAIQGCRGPDYGYVQREWSKNMRELGIVPVFPPREDFYVGDLYASVDDPDSATTEAILLKKWSALNENERGIRRRIGMSPRLGRLDLNARVNDEYDATISAPPTSPAYNTMLGNAAEALLFGAAEAEKIQLKKHEAEKLALQREGETFARMVETAMFEKETKDLAVNRLREDLAAAQTDDEKAEIRQKLNAAIQDQRKAEDDLRANERSRDEHLKAAGPRLAEFEAMITKSRSTIETSEKLARDLQLKAERLLYEQPVYPDHNIYSGLVLRSGSEPTNAARDSRLNRMRVVGFPEFLSATFTQGDLSALIPIEGFLLGIDLSGSRVSRVSVKVPAAESYGISLANLLKTDLVHWPDKTPPRNQPGPPGNPPGRGGAIIAGRSFTVGSDRGHTPDRVVVFPPNLQAANATQDKPKAYLRADLLRAMRFQIGYREGKPDAPSRAYLRVITEVFYARALDVNVTFDSAIGGRTTVGPPVPALDVGSAATQVDSKPGDSSAGLPAPDPNNPLASVLASIGQGQSVPGGAVQFVSSSSRSIGLRRVFHRPVAIGFRGVTLTVDLSDGFVSSVQVSNSAVVLWNQSQ